MDCFELYDCCNKFSCNCYISLDLFTVFLFMSVNCARTKLAVVADVIEMLFCL